MNKYIITYSLSDLHKSYYQVILEAETEQEVVRKFNDAIDYVQESSEYIGSELVDADLNPKIEKITIK